MFMEQSVHRMVVILYLPGCFYFPFLKKTLFFFLPPLLFVHCSLDTFFHFCCFCKGINALLTKGCLNLLYNEQKEEISAFYIAFFLHSSVEI